MNTKGQPRLRFLFNQIGWRVRKYHPGHARHRKSGPPSISKDIARDAAILVLSLLFATMLTIVYLIVRINS